jgi:RimJ/RimL family protein N-acetyltransferase
MPSFETARLYSRPLTLDEYSLLDSKIEPEWTDLKNPFKYLMDGSSALKHRIPKVKLNPKFSEIALFLAIEKESKILIGSVGFHDVPSEKGMIEIGIRIIPDFQGKGYGQELLLGAWTKISENPEVKIFRYTVSPENAPSLHIAKKYGLNLVGQQIDEEVGIELIFEIETKDFKF